MTLTLPLDDVPADARNVLLLTPAMESGGTEACLTALAHDRPAEQHVLAITLGDRAETYVDNWRDSVDELPRQLVAVEARTGTSRQRAWNDGQVVIRSESPGDLTALGIQTTEFLTRWTDAPGRISVCFNSITMLLQYVELNQAFRFLHVFCSRTTESDARAHFHMANDAHDPQTIATVKQLFDAVVAYDDEASEYTVQTR